MNKKSTLLFFGFLIVCSIYWAGKVLYALSSNIIGVVLPYDILPWLEVITTIISILVTMRLLNRVTDDLLITPKRLIQISIVAVLLMILSEFSHLYDYSAAFCGNALIDGELDELFEKRANNEIIVNYTKSMFLAISILIYSGYKIKSDSNHTK